MQKNYEHSLPLLAYPVPPSASLFAHPIFCSSQVGFFTHSLVHLLIKGYDMVLIVLNHSLKPLFVLINRTVFKNLFIKWMLEALRPSPSHYCPMSLTSIYILDITIHYSKWGLSMQVKHILIIRFTKRLVFTGGKVNNYYYNYDIE